MIICFLLKILYICNKLSYMIKTTVVDKEKKGKINWLFPDENKADMDITVEDFRQMVQEAEKGEGMSLPAYKEKMNVWWQNHL